MSQEEKKYKILQKTIVKLEIIRDNLIKNNAPYIKIQKIIERISYLKCELYYTVNKNKIKRRLKNGD